MFALSVDIFLFQFYNFAKAGEGFQVGEFLVTDDDPHTVLISGNVLLMEVHNILSGDGGKQAYSFGIGIAGIAVAHLIGHVFGNSAECRVVVLDVAEYTLTGGLQVSSFMGI